MTARADKSDPWQTADAAILPGWVPDAARHYLRHVNGGTPIRALAREASVHASTILRQVRRFETLRDDPLVDEALQQLARHLAPGAQVGAIAGTGQTREETVEKAAIQDQDTDKTPGRAANDTPGGTTGGTGLPPSEARVLRDGLRILRHLNAARTVLAVARDMEMGVVVQEGADGAPERLAVVGREIAQAMALKDWISCADPAARVIRYHITATGRQELRRTRGAAQDGPSAAAALAPGGGDGMLRHMRSLMRNSPVAALARRRKRDGSPWLDRAQITAAERLREDYELSQTGLHMAADWESFVTAASSPRLRESQPPAAREAGDRLIAALNALGPGLADVALRCCCYLEGLESIEERLAWSARSGKVVLRVALDQLHRHYIRTYGPWSPPIG